MVDIWQLINGGNGRAWIGFHYRHATVTAVLVIFVDPSLHPLLFHPLSKLPCIAIDARAASHHLLSISLCFSSFFVLRTQSASLWQYDISPVSRGRRWMYIHSCLELFCVGGGIGRLHIGVGIPEGDNGHPGVWESVLASLACLFYFWQNIDDSRIRRLISAW